jgi:hypothetical protein
VQGGWRGSALTAKDSPKPLAFSRIREMIFLPPTDVGCSLTKHAPTRRFAMPNTMLDRELFEGFQA